MLSSVLLCDSASQGNPFVTQLVIRSPHRLTHPIDNIVVVTVFLLHYCGCALEIVL